MMPVDVQTSGRWSDGAGSVVRLFQEASHQLPELVALNSDSGLPLYLRGALPPRVLASPFVMLPQNAWPWSPHHGRGRTAARWAALRVATWTSMQRATAVVRLSTAIPVPTSSRSLSPLPNVLDAGYEEALREPSEDAPWMELLGNSFVAIGSMMPYRNYVNLVTAHRQYRAVGGARDLLIVGIPLDGHTVARVQRQAAQDVRDGRVHFVANHQPRARILSALSRAAGIVLPSLCEASPLSLLEALAGGPPVAASAIPGNVETAGAADRHVTWMDGTSTTEMAAALHELEESGASGAPHRHEDFRILERRRWMANLRSLLTNILERARP